MNKAEMDAKNQLTLERVISGHSSYIFRHSWSPDGKKIATPSADNTIKIWNASNGEEMIKISSHSNEVNSVVWSSSGRYLASCSDDKSVVIIDLNSNNKQITLNGHIDEVNDISWHPKEGYIASVSDDRNLIIYKLLWVETGECKVTQEIFTGHKQAIWSVEWSKNGEWLATGSDDETIRLVRFGQNEQRTLRGHNSTVRCIKWFSDSKRIISAGRDGNLILWNIDYPDTPIIKEAHSSIVTSVDISFDGKIIVSRGNDGAVRFWDANSLDLITETLGPKCERWSISISFSPVDNQVVTLGEDCKSLRLWRYKNMSVQEKKVNTNESSIFISYSHKDKPWLKRLTTMLEPLLRNYKLSIWSDTDINTGDKWKKEIEANLANSDVVVMLVSPDFLASKFIMEVELPKILQKSEKENTAIVWIPIRHALFEESGLIEFQAGTDPNKPLASIKRSEADAILAEICRTICQLIQR